MTMETAPNTPRTVSVRSVPTRVLGAVALAFCAFFAVNLLLTGTPASIWHFLPWVLLAAWGVYVLLWRPRLLIHATGLSIRNILRDHEIPFSELTALRVMQNVSFDTTAGRIPSWGAPGSGKLGPKMLTGTGGARTMAALPHTQTAVQTAWDAWERGNTASLKHDGGTSSPADPPSQHGDQPGDQPGRRQKVVSGWNLPAVVVGVLLLVLAITSMLT